MAILGNAVAELVIVGQTIGQRAEPADFFEQFASGEHDRAESEIERLQAGGLQNLAPERFAYPGTMYPSLGTTWNDVPILPFSVFGKWNQTEPYTPQFFSPGVTIGGDNFSDQAAETTYASDGTRLVSVSDTLLLAFQGLLKRKNKFPGGEVRFR